MTEQNAPRVDCELCAELAGQHSRFNLIYGDALPGRIVAQTNRFVVMPSLGQLGCAHLMVVSKSHLTAVSLLDHATRVELSTIIGHCRNWLRTQMARNVLVFENGDPEGRGRMGCSVSHLHVHMVASDRSLSGLYSVLASMGAEYAESLISVNGSKDAYSCAQLAERGALLVRRRLPSQTLRRLVAKELGELEWDWRQVAREEKLIRLVEKAQAELSMNEETRAA